MALEAFYRRQGVVEPLDAFASMPTKPEVVRSQRGEQAHADVRRRRAVRDRRRLLLDIVRRQPVVLRTCERLEVAPRLARDLEQERRDPPRRARVCGARRAD